MSFTLWSPAAEVFDRCQSWATRETNLVPLIFSQLPEITKAKSAVAEI